ncbi:MAG: hypothetical protein GY696_06935 [Gammaproteobacteria bacterium]|nr:hypothetical protein [Gammaproteobacteria bacterium]
MSKKKDISDELDSSFLAPRQEHTQDNPYFPEMVGDFTVDDAGIPILDDVISPDESILETRDKEVSSHNTLSPGTPFELNLPNHNELLAAMRWQLKKQLQQDMDSAVEQITTSVVAHTTQDLESIVRKELQRSLEERIEEIIDQALDEQLLKRT